jgi:hypothetical protein
VSWIGRIGFALDDLRAARVAAKVRWAKAGFDGAKRLI